jgi:hypothetical protein
MLISTVIITSAGYIVKNIVWRVRIASAGNTGDESAGRERES